MGSRRKIRMEHGDTLGGTVPLLLRDHVEAGYGQKGFGRRRRDRGGGFRVWFWSFLVALVIALAIVFFLAGPDRVDGWLTELWDRVVGFFDVPPPDA